MVLLESDVQDLADAHVYLDDANPKAALATDLLLGTQGWRRFAMVKTGDFLEKYGDAARRMLAMRVVTKLEIEEAELNDRLFLGVRAKGIGAGGMPRGANGANEWAARAALPPAPMVAAANAAEESG